MNCSKGTGSFLTSTRVCSPCPYGHTFRIYGNGSTRQECLYCLKGISTRKKPINRGGVGLGGETEAKGTFRLKDEYEYET